jgi:hypothetical protein
MSASSPSSPVTVRSPLLEVDTYVGTLSTLKTPSAAELNVQFYSKEREKVSKALEKAKKALENAELALLNSRSHCFRLHPSRYEEVKTAKLRVRQEERNVQDTKKDKKEREKVMDKMQHEWNLKYGAVELSSANKVNKLVHTLSTTSPSAMDPWESKLSNANSRPEGLRERVAEYYGHCERTKGGGFLAKCCLTGIIGNRKVVTSAHLLPRNAPGHFLQELDIDNVDHFQNMVILCQNIEKTFDKKQLCFVLDEEDPLCFVLKIWDQGVKDKLVFEGDPEARTIGSYDGRKMRFKEDKVPFKRVLSLHAQCSYETAKKMNWINEDEPKPVNYASPLEHVRIPNFRELFHQSSTDLTRMATSSSDWISPVHNDRTTDHSQPADLIRSCSVS